MKIQPIRYILGVSLVLSTTVPACAESFSFSLDGLGVTERVEGGQTLRGSLSINTEQSAESQTIDFDLTHGGDGGEQFLDLGLRDQDASILEVVFNVFGLNRRRRDNKLETNVSGEINPTESDLNVSLGEDMPGMRIHIKTPPQD